ncbi:hypothetical protein ABT272_45260 [Streptomyces sp900105245]|uniref:Secreted protein n=1 Tax=Streptomyces sp. 900105245 TaxID=3154379 RepID=A0ABV1ULS6_9ACTN
MRFLGKRFAGGAAVFGMLAMAAMAGAQPAAASSNCELKMEKHDFWEGHTICASSRVGALIDRIEFWGDDSWPFSDHKVGGWVAVRETPANGEIVVFDEQHIFNEDSGIPYEDDEVYAKVFMRDPATNTTWEVRTNTVSGDFG